MSTILQEISSNGIVLAVLSSLSSYLLFRVQSQKEKIKNIESQLSDKKYQLYHKIVSLYYQILYDVLDKKDFEREIYKSTLFDCKRDILIYGFDDVFNKFSELLQLSGSGDTNKILSTFLDLMVLIRKDMGNQNTKINRDSVLLSIMQDKEAFTSLKKILS